jgi:hypothetical protein
MDLNLPMKKGCWSTSESSLLEVIQLEHSRSQTGLIKKIAGVTGLTHSNANKLPAPNPNPNLIWKSFLQTEISLSTLEDEYSALSNALKTLLPLKQIIKEALLTMKLPKNVGTTVLARAFQDNKGAYFLVKNQWNTT